MDETQKTAPTTLYEKSVEIEDDLMNRKSRSFKRRNVQKHTRRRPSPSVATNASGETANVSLNSSRTGISSFTANRAHRWTRSRRYENQKREVQKRDNGRVVSKVALSSSPCSIGWPPQCRPGMRLTENVIGDSAGLQDAEFELGDSDFNDDLVEENTSQSFIDEEDLEDLDQSDSSNGESESEESEESSDSDGSTSEGLADRKGRRESDFEEASIFGHHFEVDEASALNDVARTPHLDGPHQDFRNSRVVGLPTATIRKLTSGSIEEEKVSFARRSKQSDLVSLGSDDVGFTSEVDELGNPKAKIKIRVKNSKARKKLNLECKKVVNAFVSDASFELSLRGRGFYTIHGLEQISREQNAVKKLTVLDFKKNKLTKVPHQIKSFTFLTNLHLDYNRLTERSFPDMSDLVNLTVVSASHNHIKSFPRKLVTAPRIESLDLRDNHIETLIPGNTDESRKEFVTALCSTLGKTLKFLDLGMNNLQGTLDPPFCEALLKLEHLSIHTNKLTALPSCFKFMDRLKVLRANGNPLQMPPHSVAISGPEAVRRFFWSLTKDGARPLNTSSTSTMPSSSSTSTTSSPIQHFYADFPPQSSASPTTNLSPEKNHSEKPPTQGEIVQWGELEDSQTQTAMENDQQESYPTAFSKSASAHSLLDHVRENFNANADSAKNAESIERPSFSAPTLSEVAQPVLDAKPDHSHAFPADDLGVSELLDPPLEKSTLIRTSSASGYHRQFKVVVLGHESAGKTSMIRTLVNGQSEMTDEDARTFGVDIYSCSVGAHEPHLEQNNEENDSQENGRKLSIWDFAGQSVYYRSHQLFLSRRTLYLIVWDINKCSVAEIDSEVCFWIYSVQARVPGAIIQIIASKGDSVSPEQARERIQFLNKRILQHETWQKNELQAVIYEEEKEARGDFASTVSVTSGISSSKHGEMRSMWTSGYFTASAAGISTHGGGDIAEMDEHIADIGDSEYHDMRPQVLLRMRPQVMQDILVVSSKTLVGFDVLDSTLEKLIKNDTLFPHVGSMACIPMTWATVEDAICELRRERPDQPVCNWAELEVKVDGLSRRRGLTVAHEDIQQCVNFLNDIGDIVHNRGTDSLLFLDSKWIVDCIKRVVDHNIAQRLSTVSHSERMKSKGAILNKESIIARDVRSLTEKGILHETLVEHLWPELFVRDKRGVPRVKNRPVYDGLFNVLEQFDVCSPLHSSIHGARRWLIPCLITNSIDLERRWPRMQSPEELGEIEIGRTFVFPRFRPPGIMAKVLTRISELFDARTTETRTWNDASIIRIRLADRRQIKLLLYVHQESTFGGDPESDSLGDDVDDDQYDRERAVLDICARGQQSSLYEMWENVCNLKEVIESILIDEYMGVTWVYMVRCPVCLSRLSTQDPLNYAHSFHLMDVELFAGDLHEDDIYQDWEDFFANQVAPLANDPGFLYRQTSSGSVSATNSLLNVRGQVCSMMCEVRSSSISDHECPLMLLLPPPVKKEEILARLGISTDTTSDQMSPNGRGLTPPRSPVGVVGEGVGRHLVHGSTPDPTKSHSPFLPRRSSSGGTDVLSHAEQPRLPYELRLFSGIIFDARCICRIGIYCDTTKRFLEQGTAFITDRSRGIIVTACHLIYKPSERKRKFFFGRLSSHRIVIACFEAEDTIPPWRYEAEILEAGDQLESFLDVLILRVTHKLKELPRSQNDTPSSIFGSTMLVRDGPADLPLPTEVKVGDSDVVHIGDSVSLLGFPLGRGETICMDNGFVVGFDRNKEFIHATPYNHNGSSGGPLLNSRGEVVGVMSKAAVGDLGSHLSSTKFLPVLNSTCLRDARAHPR